MKKGYLIFILWFFIFLTACGGGSNSLSGNNSPPVHVNLIPLDARLSDLSGNNINYVDISKAGSHYSYKLTLTNLNPVAVNISMRPSLDLNWVDYNASLTHTYPTDHELQTYFQNFNPEILNIAKYFQRTTNNDDCFNIGTIRPNASCSYYLMAVSYDTNTTRQSIFSLPLTYSFYQTTVPLNSLTVQQCQYDPAMNEFYCPNTNKPGYSGQFISYKNLPRNGVAPIELANYHNSVSNDGKWFYQCNNAYPLNCGKYLLNYDLANNILSLASNPTSSFTLSGYSVSYGAIDSVNVTPDGNMAWYVMHDNSNGYTLVNSSLPNHIWDGFCSISKQCVPNIIFSSFNGAVIGLDGSFWWNSYNTEVTYNANFYDPKQNIFVPTNILVVAGVNADGTVISANESKVLSCFRKVTESQYSQTPIKNYQVPSDGAGFWSSYQNVYVKMDVNSFVDYSGQTITLQPYFKVHTENGKCEVELDDFIFAATATLQYSYGSNSSSESLAMTVISISNIYVGK